MLPLPYITLRKSNKRGRMSTDDPTDNVSQPMPMQEAVVVNQGLAQTAEKPRMPREQAGINLVSEDCPYEDVDKYAALNR